MLGSVERLVTMRIPGKPNAKGRATGARGKTRQVWFAPLSPMIPLVIDLLDRANLDL